MNAENFYARKTLRLTELECRTWLHVPSGTYGPPAVTLTKYLKCKKELIVRWIHQFKLGLNKQYGPYVHLGY